MKWVYILVVGAGTIIGLVFGGFYANQPKTQTLKTIISSDPQEKLSITPTKVPLPGLPQRIVIPKINIDAPIESVSKDSLGRMDVPSNFENTAWYSLGPKPGEEGSAVIDGHVDTPAGAPSVFWNIGKLSQGDTIKVYDDKDIIYIFSVTSVQTYDLNSIPLEQIFSHSTPPMLNLITCSGNYDIGRREYLSRTVVYARLIK